MSDKALKTYLTLDSRIELIQRELFYHFKQAWAFWRLVLILMKQPRNKTKINGALLTGDPSAGKSTLIRQMIVIFKENVIGFRVQDIEIFSVPQGVGPVMVFAQLCKSLGIPDIPSNPKNYSITYFILKAAAKLKQDRRLLIIDEFQNLYEIPGVQRKRVISALNQLINQSRIPIILVGVTGVDDILKNIEDDDSNLKGTFSSRFPEFQLRKWEDPSETEYISILMSIWEDCHLRPSEDQMRFYSNETIRNQILQLTDGLLGKIVLLIKRIAVNLISNGQPEIITTDQLIVAAKELEMQGWEQLEQV